MISKTIGFRGTQHFQTHPNSIGCDSHYQRVWWIHSLNGTILPSNQIDRMGYLWTFPTRVLNRVVGFLVQQSIVIFVSEGIPLRPFDSILSHITISYDIWANYNNSLTWIKAIWGWFPLLTMISRARSQWGRYNLPIWYGLWESNSRFFKSTVCFDDFPTEAFKFAGYFLRCFLGHRSHEVLSRPKKTFLLARLHQQDVMPIPAGLVEGRCWDRWWALFWRTEHHQM